MASRYRSPRRVPRPHNNRMNSRTEVLLDLLAVPRIILMLPSWAADRNHRVLRHRTHALSSRISDMTHIILQ